MQLEVIQDLINSICNNILKDLFVQKLSHEADEYQVMSDINKKVNNINPRLNTLNVLIPMTYKLVADVLEDIELVM